MNTYLDNSDAHADGNGTVYRFDRIGQNFLPMAIRRYDDPQNALSIPTIEIDATNLLPNDYVDLAACQQCHLFIATGQCATVLFLALMIAHEIELSSHSDKQIMVEDFNPSISGRVMDIPIHNRSKRDLNVSHVFSDISVNPDSIFEQLAGGSGLNENEKRNFNTYIINALHGLHVSKLFRIVVNLGDSPLSSPLIKGPIYALLASIAEASAARNATCEVVVVIQVHSANAETVKDVQDLLRPYPFGQQPIGPIPVSMKMREMLQQWKFTRTPVTTKPRSSAQEVPLSNRLWLELKVKPEADSEIESKTEY